MIVIDVGCARYGGDYSIERLIEEFKPRVLYGFDPSWGSGMFEPETGMETSIAVQSAAAWTYDGAVHFQHDGLNGCISSLSSVGPVPCIDLARFIDELPDEEIVLKMDAEGSEYELLEALIERGVDARLKLAWVEWHPFGAKNHEMRREWIENHIRCPIEEWRW